MQTMNCVFSLLQMFSSFFLFLSFSLPHCLHSELYLFPQQISTGLDYVCAREREGAFKSVICMEMYARVKKKTDLRAHLHLPHVHWQAVTHNSL